MHEGDELQPLGLTLEAISEPKEREPIDHRDGAFGQSGKRRARCLAREVIGIRKFARELDRLDRPAFGAQSLDDMAVEQIPARELIERAGDQERNHPSGPSKAAQATGDSRTTIRSEARAPAVPGPSALSPIRAFSLRKISPARNSVVVLRPRNSGSSSRFR